MITIAILAVVHRKLGRKFKPTQETKAAEEQSSQTWDNSEAKEAFSTSNALHNSNYRSHPPWDKGDISSDSRPDTIGNHFICQTCSSSYNRKTFPHRTNCRGIQPNIEEEWSTYLGSDQWEGSDVCSSGIKDKGMKMCFWDCFICFGLYMF